jgi:perosamine synthetase
MRDDVARRIDIHRDAVTAELAFMKSAATLEELVGRSVPLAGGAGMLVPLCELHARDTRLIATLAGWHGESVAHTTAWLRNLLADPGRIVFLVQDRFGHTVGQAGLASSAPAERALAATDIVFSAEAPHPAFRAAALEGLRAWAEDCFRPARIDGVRPPRVRADDGETILTAGPSISPREVAYATDAARHGWNRRWSGYITRFEQEFAEYVGAEHAIATSSCTGALHLAMLAIGLGPGDEAIVPEQTWVATAKAVTYMGATPVFADVQADSWCLDPASVEAAITERTKAIVPVHLYGHPADMDGLRAVADRHGLPLIEDAAPAIGAELRGRRVGALGTAGAFSFQGAKLLVTGEGGMLVTNDADVYAKAYKAWDLGVERSRGFWIDADGLKYKLPNVAAALGLGQLERIDHLIEAKREIFGWYAEELDGLDGITLNHEAEWARSIYWMSSILVDPACGIDRDGMRAALAAAGVDSRPTFPRISTYPIWAERRAVPAPVSQLIAERGINLPSGVRLRRDQVARVGEVVRRAASSATLRRAA